GLVREPSPSQDQWWTPPPQQHRPATGGVAGLLLLPSPIPARAVQPRAEKLSANNPASLSLAAVLDLDGDPGALAGDQAEPDENHRMDFRGVIQQKRQAAGRGIKEQGNLPVRQVQRLSDGRRQAQLMTADVAATLALWPPVHLLDLLQEIAGY